MRKVRIRVKIEFIQKVDQDKIITHQSKLIFNGIHKSYENLNIYTFKPKEVLMDKPIYLGFPILELSNCFMYETSYDKIQTYFGEKNLLIHYISTDKFILSVNTKDIIKDFNILEEY